MSAIISQSGPLPEELVWTVTDQLLQYLDRLHSQNKCHRCFSLSTIGIDSAGELEIASTESPLTISELVRLHAPLPSCLRHEFDLVVPSNACEASTLLSHAGFGADATALDLFQVAVLLIRLVFEVEGEKFLSSPCLQETLPPPLAQALREILAASKNPPLPASQLRSLLPGAANLPAPLDVEPPSAVEASPLLATPLAEPLLAEPPRIDPPVPEPPAAHWRSNQGDVSELPIAMEVEPRKDLGAAPPAAIAPLCESALGPSAVSDADSRAAQPAVLEPCITPAPNKVPTAAGPGLSSRPVPTLAVVLGVALGGAILALIVVFAVYRVLAN